VGPRAQEASEALNQIIGYFPAELSVGELERPQKDFVLKALGATRTNLASFLALLPQQAVKGAFAQVADENKLNAIDYQNIFGEPMLNAPPPKGK
jgi:predicted lysophospholipase L1 biosynthesis ABC-type transport system permease subunit